MPIQTDSEAKASATRGKARRLPAYQEHGSVCGVSWWPFISRIERLIVNNANERKLVQKLNRWLKRSGGAVVVKCCRHDSQWLGELGRFYAVNMQTNRVEARHIDPATWLAECQCELNGAVVA